MNAELQIMTPKVATVPEKNIDAARQASQAILDAMTNDPQADVSTFWQQLVLNGHDMPDRAPQDLNLRSIPAGGIGCIRS